MYNVVTCNKRRNYLASADNRRRSDIIVVVIVVRTAIVFVAGIQIILPQNPNSSVRHAFQRHNSSATAIQLGASVQILPPVRPSESWSIFVPREQNLWRLAQLSCGARPELMHRESRNNVATAYFATSNPNHGTSNCLV